MDYSDIFSYMQAEVTLIAVIVLLFLYDLIAGERGRRRFSAVACGLLAVQVLANVVPGTAGEVFGGMFCYVPMHTVVKSVLAIGALIVCLQADTWLRRDDTAHKQGEFYILLLSTLLGMYFMVGAGNFLLFFLGMELASVPMACLVAFDKYKHHSAEAGAKYILCSTVSRSSTGRRGRSISTIWRRALRGRRCRSWRWSSSSPGWGSRFRSCRSISGRPIPTRVRRRP